MQDFSTHFFLPSWWVRAFECVSSTEFEAHSALEQIIKMRISPTMTAQELSSLCIVLSSLQKQLLVSKRKTLQISPVEFQKQTHLSTKQKLLSSIKTLQSILGLKFVTGEGVEYLLQPLVTKEVWRTYKSASDLSLELSLSECGGDWLLGYTNPHLELIRVAENLPVACDVLRADKPLSVWKSAWFDLQGVEQTLLLRIEKAMQWEYAWLHFEGIFGKDLLELVANLTLTSGANSTSANRLQMTQACLEKLGKKLYQHGLLKLGVEDEFLALSGEEKQSLLLVWQVSKDKAFSTCNDDYQRHACMFLVEQSFPPHLSNFVRLLSGDSFSQHIQTQASDLWRNLLAVDSSPLFDAITLDSSAAPLTAAPLFLEWAIRQELSSPFPLPECVATSPLAKLARFSSDISLSERLSHFCDFLKEEHEWRENLPRVEGVTLASRISQNSKEFSSYLQNIKQHGFVSRTNILQTTRPTQPSSAAYTNSTQPLSTQAREDIEKKSFSQKNIKVMAAEELKRMMSVDREKFIELKKKFFASLEPAHKKIILDVQSRMQPTLFDNHLRQSLIKFMIENPSEWKGAVGKTILLFSDPKHPADHRPRSSALIPPIK